MATETGGTEAPTLSTIVVERDAEGLRIEELPATMGCKGGQLVRVRRARR